MLSVLPGYKDSFSFKHDLLKSSTISDTTATGSDIFETEDPLIPEDNEVMLKNNNIVHNITERAQQETILQLEQYEHHNTIEPLNTTKALFHTIKLQKYKLKILYIFDKIFCVLDNIYKNCFEKKYSGISFAAICIAIISTLYVVNPGLMSITFLLLTVFYCYVVFHKRVYKKLIYQLLVPNQSKILNKNQLYNKRVKLLYIVLIAATIACSLIVPAWPVISTIASITTLMKLLGNSDYFGFYDNNKDAIVDKNSTNNSQLIKKILLGGAVGIASLVVCSVFLTQLSLLGISLAIIAQVMILAITMFVNCYYRIAKDKNQEAVMLDELYKHLAKDKNQDPGLLQKIKYQVKLHENYAKAQNKIYKCILVITNCVLFILSIIWLSVKNVYTNMIGLIKLSDAIAYFGLKSRKARIIAEFIVLAVFIPLICFFNIMLSILMIISIGLLLKKKIYEAFALNVENSSKTMYNKIRGSSDNLQRFYKQIIVVGICLSFTALSLGLFLTGVFSVTFFVILLLLVKLCDEIYKERKKKNSQNDTSELNDNVKLLIQFHDEIVKNKKYRKAHEQGETVALLMQLYRQIGENKQVYKINYSHENKIKHLAKLYEQLYCKSHKTAAKNIALEICS
jgi:hypothetical protein